jgi:hypothetical protein
VLSVLILLTVNKDTDQPKNTSVSFPAISSSVSAYSALEKDLSQKFGENKDKYEILSYDVSSFDNSADSIKAVISYYDKSKKSKTNLAIYTSHGIGYLDLAGRSKDFEVLDNEKVKIASNSTVCIALKNIPKNEIINYEVKYTYDPAKNEDKFTVSANKRG